MATDQKGSPGVWNFSYRSHVMGTQVQGGESVTRALLRLKIDDPYQQVSPRRDLGKFSLFPKFPKELRLQIWREAFPDGQHINLDVPRYGTRTRDFFVGHSKGDQLPPTLFVNRESRAETLS
jgi:hypothetical protein